MRARRAVTSAVATAIVAAVVVGSFAGCVDVFFHPSGGPAYPANPPNCRIRVVAADPGNEFEEIGTLSVDGSSRAFRDPDDFKREARAQICRAGGNLVVTQVNGFGSIVRGVVFRRRPEEPEAEAEAEACDPVCSPGFDCKGTQCVPVCNPDCEAGEVCGRDRLCHPHVDSVAQ